jgi:hypothetical protein
MPQGLGPQAGAVAICQVAVAIRQVAVAIRQVAVGDAGPADSVSFFPISFHLFSFNLFS